MLNNIYGLIVIKRQIASKETVDSDSEPIVAIERKQPNAGKCFYTNGFTLANLGLGKDVGNQTGKLCFFTFLYVSPFQWDFETFFSHRCRKNGEQGYWFYAGQASSP